MWITDHDIILTMNNGGAEITARTNIEAEGGTLYLVQTGSMGGGVWLAENHPMVAEPDRVVAAFLTGTYYAAGASSEFEGSNLIATGDGLTTFLIRVYNADGLSDCVAWGHDPAGLVAGDYDADVTAWPTDPDEIPGCRVEL